MSARSQTPLPPLPNCQANQIHFRGPYSALASDIERHYVSPYPDSSDHLLSFAKEPEGPWCLANRGLNPYNLYGDESTSTTTASSTTSEATSKSSSSAPASSFSEHTIVKMVSSTRSRGRREDAPDPAMTSKILTQDSLDKMVHICPTHGLLGAVALPMAVAATAMGLFNRAQIKTLQGELFQNFQATRQLFEVIQDFLQNFAGSRTPSMK